MPLSNDQITKIKANIRKLDYLEGAGILSNHSRHLVNEAFLFISSGGNGHKALATLRNQLRWKVDAKDLKDRVAFLAIDAAAKELDELQEKYDFSEIETLRLPYEGALQAISPDAISPQLRSWVDPDLYQAAGGNAIAAAAQNGFDDTGAGARRQASRVRLCMPNTIDLLKNRITSAVRNLLQSSPDRDTPTKLNVFFVAGLAGGTGSGTIVDLPYLTRQIVKSNYPGWYANIKVAGFLLLPSACGDRATLDPAHLRTGNINAYAALKEIDYFMGLQDRGEAFHATYGTFDVNCSENIFDFCTLVEGITANGMFTVDPANTARNVLANSIINMMCTAQPGGTAPQGPGGNNNSPFLIDSFLSNRAQLVPNAIAGMSHRDFPRDSNYCYSIIGYAACVVPIDLMTVYVAKKVFDGVWNLFNRYREADEDAARKFLEDAELSPDRVKKAHSYGDLLAQFKNRAAAEFRSKGPYYMVNLMHRVADVIDNPGEFASYARKKAEGMFVIDKDGWTRAAKHYARLSRAATSMGNNLYAVYTMVIQEISQLIEQNAKLLTSPQRHKSLFGQTFSWSPIDLTPGDNANNVVMTYLDDLLSPREVQQKVEDFINELCDHKEQWTQLVPPEGKGQAAFDASDAIRQFIKNEFSGMVNATMETFLIKFYSGDPNATVPVEVPQRGSLMDKTLRTAASEIVKHLRTDATPLAEPQAGFNLNSCVRHNFITIPQCTYLDGYIRNLVVANGLAPHQDIYTTTVNDQITMYSLYIGVPAWALSWVKEAEEDYETAFSNISEQTSGIRSSVGLHMEMGDNGHDWHRYPDLFNRTLFNNNSPAWAHYELLVQQEACRDLDHAKELGLVTANNSLYLPDESCTADFLIGLAELQTDKAYTAEEVYAILSGKKFQNDLGEQKPAMPLESLYYTNQVLTTTDVPAPPELSWQLAQKGLRRKMDMWAKLKKALPVVEEMHALLDQHNTNVTMLERQAQRSLVFKRCLTGGLLTYNALRSRWIMQLDNQAYLGPVLSDHFEQDFKEYYAAQAFYLLDEDTYQAFVDILREQDEQATDAELQAIRTRGLELQGYFSKLVQQKKPDADLAGSYPMASIDFEEKAGAELAGKIRTFYNWLIRQLP